MNKPIVEPLEIIGPAYSIYRLGSIFKIVAFKSQQPRLGVLSQKKQSYDHKLEASLSRTRRLVLEKGLCNEWGFFCTFTLDKSKFDRFNLNAWHKDFAQWIRDQRKKLRLTNPDSELRYMFVPELHGDGAWHMHGVLSADVAPLLVSFKDWQAAGHYVPYNLISGGFYNWPDYQRKFGFCSLGPLRSPVGTAFYMIKYISKSLGDSNIPLGAKLYYCNQGLEVGYKHLDLYSHHSSLEPFLTLDCEFCRVGYTSPADGFDFTFSLDLADQEGFSLPLQSMPDWLDESDLDELDSMIQSSWYQTSFDDYVY